MSAYSFETSPLTLPQGAHIGGSRRYLRRRGQLVCALTQGLHRNYVHPVYTPSGFALTAEAPADHPHHQSLWIGADHVHALMPAASGTFEEYTYNFYVNDVFQGRAPGRIVEIDCVGEPIAADSYRIEQTLQWRAPSEWGSAAGGRLVASERRCLTVSLQGVANRFRVESLLTAECSDIRLGPTRHAWFNLRLNDSVCDSNARRITHAGGNLAKGAATLDDMAWLDFSGAAGGGHVAGITVIPDHVEGVARRWFVADWGVVSVAALGQDGVLLRQGEYYRSACEFLVHDGPFAPASLPAGMA